MGQQCWGNKEQNAMCGYSGQAVGYNCRRAVCVQTRLLTALVVKSRYQKGGMYSKRGGASVGNWNWAMEAGGGATSVGVCLGHRPVAGMAVCPLRRVQGHHATNVCVPRRYNAAVGCKVCGESPSNQSIQSIRSNWGSNPWWFSIHTPPAPAA